MWTPFGFSTLVHQEVWSGSAIWQGAEKRTLQW